MLCSLNTLQDRLRLAKAVQNSCKHIFSLGSRTVPMRNSRVVRTILLTSKYIGHITQLGYGTLTKAETCAKT